MSLPDGAFPRLNASMVQSGQWNNSIASVIGKSLSFDGASILEFECVDGGKINVNVDPNAFTFVPGRVMEVMGSINDDGSIQVRVVSGIIICDMNGSYHVSCEPYVIVANKNHVKLY